MLIVLRTNLDSCVAQCNPAALLTQGVESVDNKKLGKTNCVHFNRRFVHLDADEVETTLLGNHTSQQGLASSWCTVQQQTWTKS